MTGITNDAIMTSIWESPEFKNGQRCFQYASFNFMTLCDKATSNERNDVRLIALADVNADEEPTGELFSGTDDDKVFFKSWDNPPFLVADSLHELFGAADVATRLVKRDDSDYAEWCETCYHSREITETVPRCVFPEKDLRVYVKEKHSAFVSDYKEFSSEFIDFFEESSASSDLIPANFSVFSGSEEKLKDLMASINAASPGKDFRIMVFLPSSFWGIVDKNELASDDFARLEKFGLMNF